MGVPVGTLQTYDRVGNREDLEDTIYNISPDDTPLVSLIGRTPVKATRHEWQIDTLRAPAANAQIEGAEFQFTTKPATTRVANFTQIVSDTLIVSDTQDAVDKAGRAKETSYQLAKMGKELRKDIELSFVSNVASSAGSASTGRVSAGFPTWITTNDSRGATGSDGGFNSGTGLVTAATNGTQRAFTKALFDDVIQANYNAGGNATHLMVSSYVKTVFSRILDDADVATMHYAANDKGKNTIIAAADIYKSDFGEILVVPNRVMTSSAASARNALLVDPDFAARGVLRGFKTELLAKTTDGEKRAIVTEVTLVMKNEAAHGVVADLFGLTASS